MKYPALWTAFNTAIKFNAVTSNKSNVRMEEWRMNEMTEWNKRMNENLKLFLDLPVVMLDIWFLENDCKYCPQSLRIIIGFVIQPVSTGKEKLNVCPIF